MTAELSPTQIMDTELSPPPRERYLGSAMQQLDTAVTHEVDAARFATVTTLFDSNEVPSTDDKGKTHQAAKARLITAIVQRVTYGAVHAPNPQWPSVDPDGPEVFALGFADHLATPSLQDFDLTTAKFQAPRIIPEAHKPAVQPRSVEQEALAQRVVMALRHKNRRPISFSDSH